MPTVVKTYSPTWKLTDSVASNSSSPNERDRIADIEFEKADIPDKFTTTEQPKSKFTFTLKFIPRDDLLNEGLYFGNEKMEEMAFALKQAGRPQPSIDYKDLNFYNFRTKVATKIDYGSMSVSFYDDSSQRALNILSRYLSLVSPVSNITIDNADLMELYINDGTASTIGNLSNKYGLIKAIRITHYHNFGNVYTKTYYDYINPKITNFILDDLDMTTSDVSSVGMTFTYDTVYISDNSSEGITLSNI